MIFATILAIAAADLQDKGTNAENARVEDMHIKDTHVKNTRVKDACVEDTRVEDTHIRDLGVYGETFPIQEKNLLEVIKAKLQKLFESGKLEDHQKTISKKAKEQLNRPSPVNNLHKTTKPRSFTHDPSITVPYDLKDHEGRVFHRQGTKVNPLETHAFRYPFLFVDGDDSEQVAWAIRQHQAAEALQKPKIILVQGAPIELSKKLNLPIYFDQSGVLVKKLGITQVPTRVSQKEKTLVVDEIDFRTETRLPESTGSK